MQNVKLGTQGPLISRAGLGCMAALEAERYLAHAGETAEAAE
ncbi:hypothetical protein [uncultured Nitratireductor sp.]|nr:hypothetical protein [uncultured Nitratireductor sp.]